MRKPIVCWFLFAAFGCSGAYAETINLGYVSIDVVSPFQSTLDIYNMTGGNSAPPDFPVTNFIGFTNISGFAAFADPSEHLPVAFPLSTSDFVFSSDGSAIGPEIDTYLQYIMEIQIDGDTTSKTLDTADGELRVTSGFHLDFLGPYDPNGTTFGVISVDAAPIAPEPASLFLVLLPLIGWLGWRQRHLLTMSRLLQKMIVGATGAVLLTCCSFASSVHLNGTTVPATGTSGATTVNLSGAGFPATEAAGHLTILMEKTCGDTAGAFATPVISYQAILGTVGRMTFIIPGNAPTGSLFVQVSGTDGGGFVSSNCSTIQVTHPPYVNLLACTPNGAIGVLSGDVSTTSRAVYAYVPNGSWSGGVSGIRVTPIEGSGSASTISTTEAVHSCASDSAIGTTVCATNDEVYVVNGTNVVDTLTGYNRTTSQPGNPSGKCGVCSVTINTVTNSAAILFWDPDPLNDTSWGWQPIDLNSTPKAIDAFELVGAITEQMVWDPFRNWVILSGTDVAQPSYYPPYGLENFYEFFASGQTLPALPPFQGGGLTTEDCSTGISASTYNTAGLPTLALQDLMQADFVDVGPNWLFYRPAGTYFVNTYLYSMPEMSQGKSFVGAFGLSVPPAQHTGIIAATSGGNTVGVFRLPSTSGSGIPVLEDYVVVPMPKDPDGRFYQGGGDPPSLSSYTSPTSGKGYGLIGDWASGSPRYLGVIDLAAALAAPRSQAHVISSSYDLVAHGVVRYVRTF